MKKIILLFLAISSLPFLGLAQTSKDTLNYQDINGKKQGPWIKKDANGVLLYEGTFKNDVPIGQFKKYHANGKLKYDMYYNPKDQKDVTVTMYDVTGELAAKGFYYNKIKDSTWQYFGQQDQVIMEESYKMGKLDGPATIYWQIGQHLPAEVKNWKDSVKEGDWFWFYENGQMRMKAHYTNNKLNGPFIVYFIDGSIHVNGAYINDYRNGKWNYYNDNGTNRAEMEYNMGKMVNEEAFEKQQTEMLKEKLSNVPTFAEPNLKDPNLGNTPDTPKVIDPDDPENFINNPESYIFKSEMQPEQVPTEKNKKKKEKSLK